MTKLTKDALVCVLDCIDYSISQIETSDILVCEIAGYDEQLHVLNLIRDSLGAIQKAEGESIILVVE